MKFRLQTKILIAFLVVTLLPLSITVGLLFQRIKQEFESDFSKRFNSIKAAIAAVYNLEEKSIRRKLDSLKTEVVIRTLLLDLKAGVFKRRGDDALRKQKQLLRDTQQLMRSAGLDVLKLLDMKGRPLAYGHRESFSMIPDKRSLEWARRYPGQPFLQRELFWRKSNRQRELTLQVATVFKKQLIVVGGVMVDRDFIQALRSVGAGTELIMFDRKKRVVLATTRQHNRLLDSEHYERQDIQLRNPGGRKPVARLAVFISRGELNRSVENLMMFALILAAIGLVLSIVLAAVLSRAIARPVSKLVEGAGQIAEGDWNVRIGFNSRDEIGELVEAFNKMASDLENYESKLRQAERIAAWKDIARQIAHEIKNPLFPIQTCIETLRKAWERQHEQFDEILDESTLTVLEEVKRLKQIVDAFSQFARMPKPSMIPLQLNSVLEHAVSLYRSVSSKIQVSAELDEDLLMIDGDVGLLNQVFINLLKNAVDALANGSGEISIRSFQHAGTIVAEVEDTGRGIEADALKKIFKPYFSQKADGTGLGLAIVHRIVSDHSATIDVESTPGSGTIFRLTFPASRGSGQYRSLEPV